MRVPRLALIAALTLTVSSFFIAPAEDPDFCASPVASHNTGSGLCFRDNLQTFRAGPISLTTGRFVQGYYGLGNRMAITGDVRVNPSDASSAPAYLDLVQSSGYIYRLVRVANYQAPRLQNRVACGDANGDGSMTSADVNVVSQFVESLPIERQTGRRVIQISSTMQTPPFLDVNGDNYVDETDVTAVNEILAGQSVCDMVAADSQVYRSSLDVPSQELFELKSDGRLVGKSADKRQEIQFSKLSNGTWAISGVIPTAGRGITYERGLNGLLTAIHLSNGRDVRLCYDADETLCASPESETDLIAYVKFGQNIWRLTHTGRVLASIAEPNQNLKTLLGWTATSQLQWIRQPMGATTKFYYSGEKLAATVDPDNFTTNFSTLEPSASETRVRSSSFDGSVEEIFVNGRPDSVIENGIRTTKLEYDALGRPIASTDLAGLRTSWTYQSDESTNHRTVAQISVPDGTSILTTEFDVNGQPTATIETFNGNSLLTKYFRNGRGDILAVETNGILSSVSSRDAKGRTSQVKSMTTGRITTLNYDGQSNLKEISGIGKVFARFDYSANGDLISTTDSFGFNSKFAYDAATGEVSSRTSPAGLKSTAVADLEGLRSSLTLTDASDKDLVSANSRMILPQLSQAGSVNLLLRHDEAKRLTDIAMGKDPKDHIQRDLTGKPGRDFKEEVVKLGNNQPVRLRLRILGLSPVCLKCKCGNSCAESTYPDSDSGEGTSTSPSDGGTATESSSSAANSPGANADDAGSSSGDRSSANDTSTPGSDSNTQPAAGSVPRNPCPPRTPR